MKNKTVQTSLMFPKRPVFAGRNCFDIGRFENHPSLNGSIQSYFKVMLHDTICDDDFQDNNVETMLHVTVSNSVATMVQATLFCAR